MEGEEKKQRMEGEKKQSGGGWRKTEEGGKMVHSCMRCMQQELENTNVISVDV